jgi:hypothetical protein
MAGISPTTAAILRAIFVVPPCVVALFALLICWGAYNEDHAHLEHRCFTEEEFVSDLPPHEQTLFRLAGHAGVAWGYTLTAAGVVALGAYICRPRSARRKNEQPPSDNKADVREPNPSE